MMKGGGLVVDDEFVYDEEKHLTVLKTSLFFANDGFNVHDCKGELVFRVDSYSPEGRDRGVHVLMDAQGRCLLTVKRKRPSLHHKWEGYKGEGSDGEKPIFSVRRSSMMGTSSVTVDVYDKPGEDYQIEGSFANRSCKIFDSSKESVAEIRRKLDISTNVVLGKDAFSLWLRPGFDAAFGMGLVLVLDQINGDEYVDLEEVQVHPTTQDMLD